MPYLSKHTSLQQLAMAGDGTPGHPQSDYNYGHTFELENKQSHRELLSQSDFQNLLIERAYNLNDILVLALGDETDPGWVSGSIGTTIDLLEQELAE